MKSQKDKIIIYELDRSRKNTYVKSTDNVPIIDINYNKNNPIVNSAPENEEIFQGNPFLYNPSKQDIDVYSIEDFFTSYKGNKLSLGEMIRNPDYSLASKKRVVRKTFKRWHKEYLKTKKNAFSESYRSIKVIKGVGETKFSFLKTLLVWILLLGMVFITEIDSVLWNAITKGSFGIFLKSSLDNMYDKFNWLKIIGNTTIYLLVFLVVYSLFFQAFIKDYKKYYNRSQKYLNNSENKINKEYRKKRKKAYKYYIKSLRKGFSLYFPPLDIKEVQEGEINIAVFNEVSRATVDKSYYVMKLEPFLKVLKNILFFLCVIGSIFLYAYSIIMIIIAAF